MSNFDPVAARTAVEQFAAELKQIEQDHPAAVQAIRQSWQTHYMCCGHKALARYLLTGDLERACRSFDR